jgi:transcriptional antiterminator RfaH
MRITMENWYCIYTKANYADNLCRRFAEFSDIEVLNPKLKRKKYIRGKLQNVIEDFFPCYIFARFDLVRYYHMIKYTRGVRRIVGDTMGAPWVVDEKIIEIIELRARDGYIHIEPNRFNIGDQVLIKGGPFSGFMGVFVEEIKPRERVLILLNTIQFEARLELYSDFVVRADAAVNA